MATQHFKINATGVSSVAAPADVNRISLYIRNYSGSGQTVWVAFGQVATAGTNGEMELVPGAEYAFGSTTFPNNTLPLKAYPTESVNVITSTGTATGCIVTE